MALTPTIRGQQSRIFSVASGSMLRTQEARLLVPYNIPTESIRATDAHIMTVNANGPLMRAEQARLMVVCRGRIASPYVEAWTFTLDGHDYYVIQLQEETLLYDFYAEEWYCWGSGSFRWWQARLGLTWTARIGGILMSLGGTVVSSVVVGDDAGSLFFLAPEKTEDDTGDSDRPTPIPFQRVVYGQLASRGRESVPCYGVELYSSAGHTRGDATNLNVTLSTSDDQGASFDDHGSLEAPIDEYNIRLDWYSLGSIVSPGRLFKLVDFGALVRIDGMEMPDGE